eukprot:6213764-Pleurochrysis_carterae.AAC.3
MHIRASQPGRASTYGFFNTLSITSGHDAVVVINANGDGVVATSDCMIRMQHLVMQIYLTRRRVNQCARGGASKGLGRACLRCASLARARPWC